MRVRLRFFALLRDKLGQSAECEAAPGATVGAVWLAFLAEHPEVARVRVRFAVDEAYVEPSYRLADGDEVAVFPPVSGGSGFAASRPLA
jgi:molybdopterin converting factor subunit 1